MFEMQGGMCYRNGSLKHVVPDAPELKPEILQESHDANYAGHTGVERTLHNVNRIY